MSYTELFTLRDTITQFAEHVEQFLSQHPDARKLITMNDLLAPRPYVPSDLAADYEDLCERLEDLYHPSTGFIRQNVDETVWNLVEQMHAEHRSMQA